MVSRALSRVAFRARCRTRYELGSRRRVALVRARRFAVILLAWASVTLEAQADANVVRLATTTSTDNSGLLTKLLPPFEAATGLRVHVVAVGSGAALQMGRDGEVDVILVHAPIAEIKFVSDGYGVNRRSVMHNDFVIVGPASDPADIHGGVDPRVALAKIALGRGVFVSQGDDSGTHRKERTLWLAAGVEPMGEWYRVVGEGMGRVLLIADELDAYTLTDRGTWLAYRSRLRLELHVVGDELMRNPYAVIAVNPDRFHDINYLGAMRLIAWLTSVAGQAVIAEFRLNGEQLFRPVAVR